VKTPRLHHADARLLLPALQAAVALPIIAIAANIRLAITATAAAAAIHAIRLLRGAIAAGALLTATALLTIIAAAPIQPPARPSSGLPSASPRHITSRPALLVPASSVARAPVCASRRGIRINVAQRAPFPRYRSVPLGRPRDPTRHAMPDQAERAQPQSQVIQLVARSSAAPDLQNRNRIEVGGLPLTVQRPHPEDSEDREDREADFIDLTVVERQAETGATHPAREAAVEGGLLEPTHRSIGEHSFSGVT
jgi:hypothetical protein